MTSGTTSILSLGCTAAIQALVSHIEGGGLPYPIFFQGMDCDQNGFQWPKLGEILNESMFNKDISAKSICSSSKYADCPLPAIGSILIPPGFRIKLKAKSHPAVIEPGQINLISYLPPEVGIDASQAVSKNIFNPKYNLTPANVPIWKSAFHDGESFIDDLGNNQDCVYPVKNAKTGLDEYFFSNSDGSLSSKRSLNSCGVRFYPSLIDVAGWPYYDYSSQSGQWPTFTSDVDPSRWCATDGVKYTIDSMLKSLNLAHPDVSFHAIDALYTQPVDVKLQPDGWNFRCRDAAKPFGYVSFIQEDWLKGNLDTIHMEFKHWDLMRFRYCTGRDTFMIGDQTIQRYKPGSQACDDFMEIYCSDSVALSNGAVRSSCACVLEKQRLASQFNGIEIPVDCFSSSCSDADEFVYKLASQRITCNATICEQIVKTQGSNLTVQGYQHLTCGETRYQLDSSSSNSANIDVVGIPFVTPSTSVANQNASSSNSSIVFTPLMLMGLGLIGFLILMFVIYFIRRWWIRRRVKNALAPIRDAYQSRLA